MAQPEIGLFHWRKSSHSSAHGECIEVAGNLSRVIGIRDSKNPDGPVHAVNRGAWRAFVQAVASGRL